VESLVFKRARLEDCIAELNRIVQESLQSTLYPVASVDMRKPEPLLLPEALTPQDKVKVGKWRDDFMKPFLFREPGATLTLELRDVSALEALEILCEITGMAYSQEERSIRIYKGVQWATVMLIPTPSILQPMATEILEDQLEENLWPIVDSSGWEPGPASAVLRPVNPTHLIFIGDQGRGKRLQRLSQKFPAHMAAGPVDMDIAYLLHDMKREFPRPTEKQELLKMIREIDWSAEWKGFEARFQAARRQEEKEPQDPDPFSELGRVSLTLPAPGVHIQQSYDTLKIEMTGPNRCKVSYSYQRKPGKYFSERRHLVSRGVTLSVKQIETLVLAFLNRDREAIKEWWSREEGGGPVREHVHDPFQGTARPRVPIL